MSVCDIAYDLGIFPVMTLEMPELKGPDLRFGIDRKEENELVLEYQKTGDEELFNKLFEQRRPTFKNLGIKYRYLEEDAESEVTIIFLKAIRRFQKNGNTKTDFNTFFYTLVKNHFSNCWRKKNRRKRTLESGERPEDSMLSLDYRKTEDSAALYEVIPDDTPANHDFEMQDYMEAMTEGNPLIMRILQEVIGGTRRQYITRDHYYIFSVTLVRGNPFHSIRTALGVPASTYEIEDFLCTTENVEFVVRVKGKAFVHYLADVFKDKIVISAY